MFAPKKKRRQRTDTASELKAIKEILDTSYDQLLAETEEQTENN